MEDITISYKFTPIICLISLDKNNENYETVKNNILELFKKIENIKNKDDLMVFRTTELDNYYSTMFKYLTKEEGKNNNYLELLFYNLVEINFFKTEYNIEQLNDKSTLIKMLDILEERKRIILYNLTTPVEELNLKDDTLNNLLEEYSKVYKKFMDTEQYNFEKHYKYHKQCEIKLVEIYKQNDKITYKDFYDIIKTCLIN